MILSIQKALRILDILIFEDTESHGISLTKLANMLGQRTPTMHNILKTMIKCGYVAQGRTGLYMAGKKCKDIQELPRVLPGGGMYAEIRGRLEKLGEEFGESINYSVLLNGRRSPVFRNDSRNPIKIVTADLESYHMYSLVTGRALTAFASQHELEEIISRNGFPNAQWHGIKDKGSLLEQLNKIKAAGYVMDFLRGDMVAMAVPVRIHPLGSIGFFAPLYRCGEDKQKLILERMLEIALSLEVFADTLT